MSVLAPPTDTSTTYAPESLPPLVSTLIADTLKQGFRRRPASPRYFANEGTTSYHQQIPYGLDSAYRPAALESLAEGLASIVNPRVKMFVFTATVSEERPITAQVETTPRPNWQHEIVAVRTHREIVAVPRLFGLDTIGSRLGYLRSLVDDDPDEGPIDIESLRAMALFIMSQRQLPDPRIGVTPGGLIQIEWQVLPKGILAMEFLPSGLIRFAAISAPVQRGENRLSVNGTLPTEETLRAVESFTARLRL